MKALVKSSREPGLWMEDQPQPVCGYNDVIIEVVKTAICGTDLHIYNWDRWSRSTIRTPMTIGHEFVGRIVKLGGGVTGLAIDDRVSGEGHITCGYCRNCRAGKRHLCRKTVGLGVNRPGCFAEYLSLPAFNVYKVPEDIDDETASILDPFGNATHTTLSFDLIGEDVLITGAGPIGIMATALAKHVGARHVVTTDVNDYRLALAKKMGASRTVNVLHENLTDIQQELGMREGFDVGLEMSGISSALHDMLASMNHGGRVAMLGIFAEKPVIDSDLIIFKGLTIRGIYGREMFETWYKMGALLQSGLDISPVITHRFAVDDFEEGFRAMNSGNTGKVILEWR
jgi:threonine 3-dehydrogenase